MDGVVMSPPPFFFDLLYSGNNRSHDERRPCAARRVNGLALVTLGLLARPMPCRLRMLSTFNMGHTPPVTGADRRTSCSHSMWVAPR
jgi:hypothetical protein